MSEIAVVAARKVRLQQRADEGDERARTALALAHDPNKFLSTVQFGITLVGVLAGAYGGATIAAKLAVPISEVPQLARYAEGIALALVVTGDHGAVAHLRRAGAEAHRAQQSRSDRVVGGAADDPAVENRRPGRPRPDRGDEPRAARVRHQGRGRAEPHRRRDQGAHQPGRRNRRGRRDGREHRPARVPARRSACRRDHDAAARHRMDRRRCHRGGAARVPRFARPHAVCRLPRRPR